MVLRPLSRVLLLLLLSAPSAASAREYLGLQTALGRPVDRHGFHFQVSFGMGGGPDTLGVFHDMELGWTLQGGTTLGMIHTFIQNKGVLTDLGGPDLIGGWMLLYKVPVIYPEIVYKIAFGPGGIHDQTDGIKAYWGVAWLYGFDLHLPSFRSSGPTLTLAAMHVVVQGRLHFGVGAGVGYTFY